MIYFSDASGNIWVVNSDGTGAHQIIPALVGWEFVSVSPDGTQLLSRDDGDGFVYLMNVDGSGQTALSFLPTNAGNRGWASWNPSGTKCIVVESGFAHNVLIVDLVGSSYTTINVPTLAYPSPAPVLWSPDGTKIAYPSSSGDGTVGVMLADGSGQADLVPLLAGTEYIPVAWFPDSTNLLINAYPASGVDAIKTDGSTPTTIYTDATDANLTPYAALSPDGSAVAIVDQAFTGVIDLLTIPGGVLTGLPSIGAGVNSARISWAPSTPPPPIDVGTPTTGIVRMGGFF